MHAQHPGPVNCGMLNVNRQWPITEATIVTMVIDLVTITLVDWIVGASWVGRVPLGGSQ